MIPAASQKKEPSLLRGGSLSKGFSLCRAARAAQKATRCAGGWQRCYAAKLLPL